MTNVVLGLSSPQSTVTAHGLPFGSTKEPRLKLVATPSSVTRFDGAVVTGAILSILTVTLLAVSTLPALSAERYLIVVSPAALIATEVPVVLVRPLSSEYSV